jgi:hypothetical protein
MKSLCLAFLFASMVVTLRAASATFTSSGTWTVPAGVTSVDVLVIAGGGGGGGDTGGGGGGGGFKHNSSYSVTPSANLSVTVGGGGAGGSTGGGGGNSSFATLTAHGADPKMTWGGQARREAPGCPCNDINE